MIFQMILGLGGFWKVSGKRPPVVLVRRKPITPDILKQIGVLWGVYANSYEVATFCAAGLSFFGGDFWPGEVFCQSSLDTSGRALIMEDVLFEESVLILTLHFSETDQRGCEVKIILWVLSRWGLCPVRALRGFLQFRVTFHA